MTTNSENSNLSAKETFRKLSTQWGVMENILEQDGVRDLAEYMTVRYYAPLTKWAKKFHPHLDELAIYEVVSDVFMEFIKNNYEKLKKLDKNRDHLRGLLTTILKRKLSKRYRSDQKQTSLENEAFLQVADQYEDFIIDFNQCLEKMRKERFLAFKAFSSFHIEGKSLKETAEELNINENAVAQRVHTARKWLREHLQEY